MEAIGSTETLVRAPPLFEQSACLGPQAYVKQQEEVCSFVLFTRLEKHVERVEKEEHTK
jgi:hypothetical protein